MVPILLPTKPIITAGTTEVIDNFLKEKIDNYRYTIYAGEVLTGSATNFFCRTDWKCINCDLLGK